MEKLKKATKRITAVAASAVMISSAAFAGGLGDYPNNFVKDGKFDAKVVVGDAADIIDTNSATALIDDLKAELTESSTKYVVTWKEAGEDGDSVDALNDMLKYGEVVGTVSEDKFDDGDADALADGTFDNEIDEVDYTQEVTLGGGEFNYKYDKNFADEIAEGIFYENNENFLNYTLKFDSPIDLTGSTAEADIEGEELTIMGNDFVVSEIKIDSTTDEITSLTLLGGANAVAMADGESTTVSIDGKDYEVKLVQVGGDADKGEVLVSVNGQTDTIDEDDSEEIGGLNIVVTEVFTKDDAGRSYAKLIFGGQKITLDESTIEINEEELKDFSEYDDYSVDVEFDDGDGTSGEWQGFTVIYETDDQMLLEKGDVLIDPLFKSFTISYDGTNEPEYTTMFVLSDDEAVSFAGYDADEEERTALLLENGDEVPSDFQLYDADADEPNSPMYIGTDVVRYFTSVSADLTLAAFDAADDIVPADVGVIPFDMTNQDVEGYAFLINDGAEPDEQFLYEVGTFNDDQEVTIKDLFSDSDDSGVENTTADWDDVLEEFAAAALSAADGVMNVTLTGENAVLALDGFLLMDLSSVESTNDITTDVSFTIDLDQNEGDIDVDNAADPATITIDVQESVDSANSKSLKLVLDDTVFENSAADAKLDADEDDIKQFVDAYGTKVTTTEDGDNIVTEIKIEVPEEQVEGEVSLNFGAAAPTTQTATFTDKAAAEAKADEVGGEVEEITTDAVDFDVTGVTLDKDVTGAEDMIVVGGPAVNAVARELLGIETYTVDQAGVAKDEGVIQYFEDKNTVLVYGFEGKDTKAAVEKLNAGNLSGDKEMVN